MHLVKNVTLKRHSVCKLHRFLHYSVHFCVNFCDKSHFINFLEVYNRYRAEFFRVYEPFDGLYSDILNVKVIQTFYNLYTENATVCVNYTNFRLQCNFLCKFLCIYLILFLSYQIYYTENAIVCVNYTNFHTV